MTDDENAIRKLIATWLESGGDISRVKSLMATDVVFLMPGNEMRGREAYAAAQKAMAGMKVQAKGEIKEVKVFGDYAYCWNELDVTVTPPGGTPVRRMGPVLSLLHRESSGRWVIYRDANMLTAMPT